MQGSTELVATIIAGPGAPLTSELMQKLAQKSGPGARIEWLSEGEAADIFTTNVNPAEWRSRLNNVEAPEPYDVIIQSAVTRRKKFLAADMESTIIQQELLDELADQIGMRDEVAEITSRAMNGEIDFGAALRARVALFDGKPISILEKAAQSITMMPGAVTLVATMKANGAKAWLVTGGFSFFARPVAECLGFDQCHANEFVIGDGVLTGEATEPLLDRNRKKLLLEQACLEYGIPMGDTVSVGDGSNDVPMLMTSIEAGGLGIAFHAKPKVREQVEHHVNLADLTALLFAQGYKRSDFREIL